MIAGSLVHDFQLLVDDVVEDVFTGQETQCMRTCGSAPSPEACTPSLALSQPTLFAFQPGASYFDYVPILYRSDIDFYGSCREELDAGDAVLARICHGAEGVDDNGDLVPVPESTGVVEGARTLVSRTCEQFEGTYLDVAEFELLEQSFDG